MLPFMQTFGFAGQFNTFSFISHRASERSFLTVAGLGLELRAMIKCELVRKRGKNGSVLARLPTSVHDT